MRVLICPLHAISMINQANLVKKLVIERGFECELKKYISIQDSFNPDNYAFLWMTLGAIDFVSDCVSTYLMSRQKKAVYITIEGVPQPAPFRYSNVHKLRFIAVSNYARKCYEQIKLKVIDVIHHAIDFQQVEKARNLGERIRKIWKNKFKDRVIFLVNSRHDPRKNLPTLAEAIKMVNETHKDKYVVLLHTDASARALFQEDNTFIISHFGTLTYDKTLALYHACDYTIFPSVCEGFGLPVLESMACGKPVLHCWFEPLSEFSSKEFNFVWDYVEEELVKNIYRQYWIFHLYPPEFLADMMKYAIDIYLNSKSEYEEYCAKAYEHSLNWDYRKVYPRLLGHLDIA